MSRWNKEDEDLEVEMSYEEEMIYNQATATVRIIEENLRLRRENMVLKRKVEENKQRVDQQIQMNIQWAGNILGKLIEPQTSK